MLRTKYRVCVRACVSIGKRVRRNREQRWGYSGDAEGNEGGEWEKGCTFSPDYTLILSGIAWSKSRPHNVTVDVSLAVYRVRTVCVCACAVLTGALVCMCGQNPIPSSAAVSIHWWPHSHYRHTHIFDPLAGLHWKSAYQDSLVSVTSWTSEAQRPGTDFH